MNSFLTESFSDMTDRIVENHPLEPFLPSGARILMLGSFPPARKRWSMDFFYPNWINDMWRITGEVFYKEKDYFVLRDGRGEKRKAFDRDRIAAFCKEKRIALFDTAVKVVRLKDNASDKFLEVVEITDFDEILRRIPECKAIITTGQKATDIIVERFGCSRPAVGEMSEITTAEGRKLDFWRMPSSSRAYPMALEAKAEYYRRMYMNEGLI